TIFSYVTYTTLFRCNAQLVSQSISYTPREKKVIELAIEEGQNLGHNYVGTEHLLLVLIREGEGIAAQVLNNLGVDLAKARKAVLDRKSTRLNSSHVK